jgi:hypothetical protein
MVIARFFSRFRYHCVLEPLTGSSQSVRSSETNQTGIVIARPVRRPVAVMEIWRLLLRALAKSSSARRVFREESYHTWLLTP